MPPKAKKIKRKTNWRGKPAGLKHGVRQLDGVDCGKAICGAKVAEDFDPVGTRLKKDDAKCQKCVRWDAAGMGVGGEKTKEVEVIDLGAGATKGRKMTREKAAASA